MKFILAALLVFTSLFVSAQVNNFHIGKEAIDTAYVSGNTLYFKKGALIWSVTITSSGSGTVSSGNQYRLPYYAATGTTLSQLPTITGNRALTSDANGLPTHSSVTTAELNYMAGVTSAIQTQINLLNARADSVKSVVIDSVFRKNATYKANGDLVLKSDSIGSANNLLSISQNITDSTRRWVFTINEANFTLNNIGGTLQTSKGGVPTNGTTGQVLTKNSNTSYDASWITPSGGGLSSDTSTSINNRILDKVNISDTASMLAPYDEINIIKTIRERYQFLNEWTNNAGTAVTTGDAMFISQNGTGAGQTVVATTDQNEVGIAACATGTTATGRAVASMPASTLRFGGGEWTIEQRIWIPDLSTSAERFTILGGFFDVLTSPNQADGAYILYDEGGVSTGSTASANWQLVTCSNSTRTFTTTSTAVVEDAWIYLKTVVNAAGNSVSFFINGINVGTHTTNIPTSSGRETSYGHGILKSVGLLSRFVRCGYTAVQCNYTTPK